MKSSLRADLKTLGMHPLHRDRKVAVKELEKDRMVVNFRFLYPSTVQSLEPNLLYFRLTQLVPWDQEGYLKGKRCLARLEMR